MSADQKLSLGATACPVTPHANAHKVMTQKVTSRHTGTARVHQPRGRGREFEAATLYLAKVLCHVPRPTDKISSLIN